MVTFEVQKKSPSVETAGVNDCLLYECKKLNVVVE